jgi:prepilin peptidase CpaA
MPRAEAIEIAVAVALTGVLAWAAIMDVRRRRIPNRAVLAVLLLSGPWLLASGMSLPSAIFAGLIALAMSYALFAFGVVGAGDAKLFSSVALFAGLAHLPALAMGTALVGGLIAAASLVARPTRALVMLQLRGAGDYGRGIPYGVAIALSGALVVWYRITGMAPLA